MVRLAWMAAVLAIVPVSALAQATPYDGWAETSQYIRSADGTRIAITVRRPTRGGAAAAERLPVIVTQDRSATFAGSERIQRAFTNHGYVWVSQDRRGTGASFGVQKGFVNGDDAKDAKAVIEWAAAQPFSNGKSVAMGCSNQGAWQYLVATLRPRGLIAIAPSCSSPMFFDDAVSMNGVPIFKAAEKPYAGECNRPPSGARPAGYVPPAPRAVDEDKEGALLKAAVAEQRCGAAMLGQYWLNMPRDGWNAHAGYRPALADTSTTNWQAVKASGIAILQIGGWFDAAVAGQIEGQRLWGGRLIMAPWIHGNRAPKGAAFANAEVDLDAEILRWFDQHAKGVRGAAAAPAIRYYVMNAPAGREWREASNWPLYPKRTLHLRDGGTLGTATPGAAGATVDYVPQGVRWFDGQYAPLGRWWSGDMAGADAKSLVHTTAPFDADTEVTGAVTARLWVSADAPDVNVFAVLEDVAPDGRSTYVTDGRLRASWRKTAPLPWGKGLRLWHRGNAADLAPLVPGKPTPLAFDFLPTAWVFKAGHRLRVSLTTSIGESWQSPPLAGGKPVTLTVYRDAAHPSAVLVPIAR